MAPQIKVWELTMAAKINTAYLSARTAISAALAKARPAYRWYEVDFAGM